MDEPRDIRYWLGFTLATERVARARGLSRGAAQKAIDDAIASGELRSSSPGTSSEITGTMIAGADFEQWLNPPRSAGGKQSRILARLRQLFPEGVPDRAERPRMPLIADLLKLDPSLEPLNPKTLQKAISSYNATRKR